MPFASASEDGPLMTMSTTYSWEGVEEQFAFASHHWGRANSKLYPSAFSQHLERWVVTVAKSQSSKRSSFPYARLRNVQTNQMGGPTIWKGQPIPL